ncbi:DUF2293 domain-containing protein [Rhizobium sp. Root483D2]|uniref:DUF2293 domain-containing protein n=1 Tax=Rhizobium sp. Root483D2 TaxID=1736545 RepID=UPI0007125D08|nr:DUF2293 domain-containing protein [Rhizobium sp. Root483D2]KQY25932.1 hypothetical protein ASD32_25975 [Rhizobium sp. Root483D2]
MARFNIEDIKPHIRHCHPRCPEFAVEFFAAEVADREWKHCTIGKAVGISMQTYLRHNMTDYDQLLLEGVEHHEAKRRVQPRVNRMIALWAPAKRPKVK